MPDDDQQGTEDYQSVDLNTHDLGLKVGQWVDAAFERFGHGERFVFMMTVHVQPPMAPGQPPAFQPAVIFWLPGAAIGTVMSGTFLITNPHAVAREEIETIVQQAVEQILTARSNDLKQMSNGHGDGPPLRLAP